MLRRLSYIVVAVAALSACSRERLAVEDMAIRFGVSSVNISTSKAIDEKPDDSSYLFTEGNQIGVFGSWTSTAGVTTDVFSHIPVICVDNGNGTYGWEYSPLKYWRKGGIYDFSAVYPYSVNSQYGSSGNRLVITYSMHADNYDLMVAAAERDLRTDDDSSPVNFTFRHACAAVRFLFCTDSGVNSYKLDNFQLQYLHAVGILVYNNGNIDVSNWNPAEFRSPSVCEWSAESLDKRMNITTKYEDFGSDAAQNGWDKWLFVIPQNLHNDVDGFHPAVQFSVNVNDDTTPVYTTLPLPENYDSSDVLWKPGYMYTYYVRIQPSTATITVDTKPWDSFYVAVDDINFDR